MPGGRRFAAVLCALALVAPACASNDSSLPVGSTTRPTQGGLTISPSEGPVGTVFNITGTGLTAGDVVAFEISFPGEGKAFPGTALTVGPEGSVSVTYRATSANPLGPYSVKLTSARGVLAETFFTITEGEPTGPTSSTDPNASTTKGTRRTTTTKASGSSTTATAQTTTTKPPVTRRTTTTSSTP